MRSAGFIPEFYNSRGLWPWNTNHPSVLHSARIDRPDKMSVVFFRRHPFKIVSGVIFLIEINVVYFWFTFRIEDEGFRYKPVNPVVLFAAIGAMKRHDQIAAVEIEATVLACPSAANAPIVGHLVTIFIALNGLPLRWRAQASPIWDG